MRLIQPQHPNLKTPILLDGSSKLGPKLSLSQYPVGRGYFQSLENKVSGLFDRPENKPDTFLGWLFNEKAVYTSYTFERHHPRFDLAVTLGSVARVIHL